MMRSLILVGAFALGSPLIGEAKELERAQICGQSGCVEIAHQRRLEQLPLGAVAAPRVETFYVLSFTVSAEGSLPERFVMYYVRSKRLLAANGATAASLTWFPAPEQVIETLEPAVAGVEPFPQPSTWPAELKSPARLRMPSRAVPEESNGSYFDLPWLLVTSTLMIALAGLGSIAVVRRSRSPAPAPAERPS